MFNFNDNGASIARFKSSGGSKGDFRPNIEDRIVEVLEVHPASNGEGYFIAKDVKDGRRFNVKISKESYDRESVKSRDTGAKNVQSYFGWLIDERFEAAVKDSKHFVLGSTKYTKKNEVVNGEATYFISTDWARQIEAYDPTKQFYGIITTSAFRPFQDEYIQNAQVWDPVAIAIDGSEESEKAIQAEMQRMDEINEKWKEANAIKEAAKEQGSKVSVSYPAKRGFQMRTFVVSKEMNEKGEYTVNTLVDSFEPLFATPAMQNDKGEVVKRSSVLDGDFLAKFIDEYSDYAYPNFTKQDPNTYNLENGEPPKDVVVEVMFFTNYLCNNMGNDNKLNDPTRDTPTPPQRKLQWMTQKETKPAFDSQEVDYYLGMNYAVKGVVQLANDSFDKRTKEVVEKNQVNRLYVSGSLKNVNFLVKPANGGIVRIDNSVRTEKELKAMEANFNVDTHSQATELDDTII